LRRHGNVSLRKYQQRGRCRRLPPTVAMLRIWGVAACAAASASARYRERHEGPDRERAGLAVLHVAEAGYAPQVDEARWLDEALLQEVHQLDATRLRDHARAELRQRVLDRRRLAPLEPLHRLASAWRASSASTLSGVMGSSLMRTPVAL
jgi:hypothetical protein